MHIARFFSADVVVERRVLWVAWAIQAAALAAFLAIAILVIDSADDDPSTAVIAVEASLLGLYLLAVAASAILGMKRLQARGRSPWLSLVALVPFGGALWYVREVGFRTDGANTSSRGAAGEPGIQDNPRCRNGRHDSA